MTLCIAKHRDEALLAGLGLVLVAAGLVLLSSTRGLTFTTATSYAAVAPMIVWLALPSAVLLLAGPWLVRLRMTALAWVIVIVVGLLLRLLWLGQPPPLDDDYFRYLWDGAMVAHGLDPYRFAPRDILTAQGAPPGHLAIAAQSRNILEQINFDDLRTIYPGVAQAAFAMAHVVAPFDIDGLRLVFLLGEVVTLALLIVLLRDTGRPPSWAALYWWNPLASAMTVGLVHVDALIPPLVLGALLANARGRPVLGLLLLGLGAGVKLWPLLLAPLLLRPLLREPRRLLAGCLVLGLALAAAVGPVLLSSLRPGSGFTAYAGGWANNNAFYAWTVHGLREGLGLGDAAERALRMTLVAATCVIALAQAWRGEDTLPSLLGRFLTVAAAVFYLSPAQFPWYAVWFLPLAALAGCWPLLLASALLPSYFLFFPPWPMEGGSLLFYAMAFIHAVPVLAWLLIAALRERRAAAPSALATGLPRQRP